LSRAAEKQKEGKGLRFFLQICHSYGVLISMTGGVGIEDDPPSLGSYGGTRDDDQSS